MLTLFGVLLGDSSSWKSGFLLDVVFAGVNPFVLMTFICKF